MNKTADGVSGRSRWEKAAIIAQVMMALGTLALAVFSFKQVGIMENTLDGSMPIVLPDITLMDGSGGFGLTNAGKENERWELNYYISNQGSRPVTGIRYFHKLTEDSSRMEVDNLKLQNRLERMILPPQGEIACGYDEEFRVGVLHKQVEKRELFRHFLVEYKDQFGGLHRIRGIWKLHEYVVGLPPMWSLVSLEMVE